MGLTIAALVGLLAGIATTTEAVDKILIWVGLKPNSLLKNSKSDVRCAIFESEALMVANLSCVEQTGLESMLPIATPQKPFSANC